MEVYYKSRQNASVILLLVNANSEILLFRLGRAFEKTSDSVL